jgi:Na+-transporting NADH:ubiquinone oxidoreductase subunit A
MDSEKIHRIRKGLDLPITGGPEQVVHPARPVSRVAVLAADYVGLKPTMCVAAGDTVRRGQPLFADKKTPSVLYTAPGAGKVAAINRGDKRALQSVVIELSERERAGAPGDDEQQKFSTYAGKPIPALSGDDVRALLLESGLWAAFRTRPFSKTPDPATTPDGIFINAMDTEPLAAKPEVVIGQNAESFAAGLAVIAKLREGDIYLCVAKDSPIQAGPYSGVSIEQFWGPHPAGTVGVHIHTLRPVDRSRTVWHLGYQDVVRIGKLFRTGRLDVEQIIALGGPPVKSPRLLRTRLGASVAELTAGEIGAGEVRVISGSVISGRASAGDVHGYLGRYHRQISCLNEDRGREFLGWLAPGTGKFSVINVFASSLQRGRKKFAFTTSTHGSERPMVPIGMYEKVMPMDLMPTFLLRALVIGDVERAERLGCLELDEEDLALCTFVCPGKYDYAPYLRQVLAQIEDEG